MFSGALFDLGAAGETVSNHMSFCFSDLGEQLSFTKCEGHFSVVFFKAPVSGKPATTGGNLFIFYTQSFKNECRLLWVA